MSAFLQLVCAQLFNRCLSLSTFIFGLLFRYAKIGLGHANDHSENKKAGYIEQLAGLKLTLITLLFSLLHLESQLQQDRI